MMDFAWYILGGLNRSGCLCAVPDFKEKPLKLAVVVRPDWWKWLNFVQHCLGDWMRAGRGAAGRQYGNPSFRVKRCDHPHADRKNDYFPKRQNPMINHMIHSVFLLNKEVDE